MALKFVFTPVAQNTIIRPLAEAVSIARGGKSIQYIDTSDHKEKTINKNNLYFLTVQTWVNGRKVYVDGRLAAFQACYKPARVYVNINDVVVTVSPKTTVMSAMAQYKRKMTIQNRLQDEKSRQKS